MPDEKLATENVILVNKPPRPADGTGDVIVDVMGRDVTLSYKDGEITDIVAGGGFDIEDLSTKTKLGIVTCYKCARDTDTGQKVCWPVPC